MPPNDSTSDDEGLNAGASERLASPPAPQPMEDLTGQRFASQYAIETRLGAGTIGQVYRARRDDGVAVALKVLDERHRPDPNVVRRFLREAEAAKPLEHPCIARILDVGTDERGRPYFCTEYVEGEPLTAWLRTGPLTLRRILVPICEALSALAEAHRRGVLHRCLKPCNVLVYDLPDGGVCVKLRDFGMGRLLKAVPGTGQTKHGFSCGAAEYMAPEQAQTVEIDGRADVYAVGILLYEALTGQVPFAGPNAKAILAKHVGDAPVPPSKLRLDRRIPSEVEAICMRALSKELRERYQSPREMRTALKSTIELLAARAELPIEAPPENNERLHRASKDRLTMPGEQLRSKQKVGVGAALLAIVCGALWMSAPGAEPEPKEAAVAGAGLQGSPSQGALTLAEGRKRLDSGDPAAAAASLRKAHALLGDDPEVLRLLGEALVRSGQKSEGAAHLQRYLELTPTAGDRAQVEALLAN